MWDLGECGPWDHHGAHLPLGEEEGVAHDHARHEVCDVRELVGGAAVSHCIDAAVGRLQLVGHLQAIGHMLSTVSLLGTSDSHHENNCECRVSQPT